MGDGHARGIDEGARAAGHDHHGHHHDHHGHHHGHHHEAQGNILVAFLLNLAFAAMELVGGVMTNSSAILSDSVHDLGDAMVIGMSWLLERGAAGGVDGTRSYGRRRLSTAGALVTTAVLLASSCAVFACSLPRLASPGEVDHDGMLLFAIFGIVVNGVAAWRTGGGGSLNQRAVSLHMLEDVLGWAAVLVGALAIRVTGWVVIDPALSIAIAGVIAYGALGNLADIVPVFLEEAPRGLSTGEVADAVMAAVPAVTGVHHVHVWSLDEDVTLATMHVAWDPEAASAAEAKAGVRAALAGMGISHATLELEGPGEECGGECALDG